MSTGQGGESTVHLGQLFVGMALLYPWATKEYLLWKMSLGQIILYYNLGIEAKYPKPPGNPLDARSMSVEELKARREELRRMYGAIDG